MSSGENENPKDHGGPLKEASTEQNKDSLVVDAEQLNPEQCLSNSNSVDPPASTSTTTPHATLNNIPASNEEEQPTLHQTRKSDADRWDGSHNPHVPLGSRQSTRRPLIYSNLSIDTQSALSGPSSQGRSWSPLGSRDAQPFSAVSAPTRSSASTSPISPRIRQRGFSLRRSVFARSVQDRSEHGSSSEPSRPEGSTEFRRLSEASATSEAGKKRNATVTVSPALPDREEIELSSRSPKHTPKRSATLPHYETWARSQAARASLRSRMHAAYDRARKTVLRVQEIPPSKDGRHILIDPTRQKALTDERTGREYVDNTISSSKYTLWNFLPRQLFAQFSKLANFYFLCVSILQMIPDLSTTGNYTTIVPLAFFVTIAMAKEGYEDIQRYKLDKAENTKETSVLRLQDAASGGGLSHWAMKKWKEVLVGDLVRLKRDEAAPADLALLHVNGANSIAYFETMALDGETNLKSKHVPASLAKSCDSVDDIARCRAHLVVEDPNIDLYNFEGKVTLAGETLPLTNNEIVYRGSLLRNTQEVVGLAIYSGEECKIRMNATKNPRIKAPALQSAVNKVVVVIVAFVIALAIFNSVAYKIWDKIYQRKAWYLTDAKVRFFQILTSFVILFNTMVPLSLYISLEIVKLFQTTLMNDIEMYDESSETPMEVRTSTINEELGQINYIFSDKTGTLTDNSMRFRKMSIAGTAWLHDSDISVDSVNDTTRRPALRRRHSKGKKPIRQQANDSRTSHIFGSPPPSTTAIDFANSSVPYNVPPDVQSKPAGSSHNSQLRTEDLLRYIRQRPHTIFAKKVRFFLLSIALCHSCLPEKGENDEINYQAASPDEAALVRAAQELGYIVVDREARTITIETLASSGTAESLSETYQILDLIEFSSNRKRMSIIVRFPDNRICVICKGADSMIMHRLRLAALAQEQATKVEKKAIKRQSLEAQEVIRRNSEQQGQTIVTGRSSISMQRHSFGGIPRPSMVAKRLQSIPDELDDWLRERETDVDFTPSGNAEAYYSPRPSQTFANRNALLSPISRLSFQSADEDDQELVEEALVIDEEAVFERCFQHISDFATEGLRILLYGYRFLREEDYAWWQKIYLEASTSLVNRKEQVERAGELIEQELELAGATAVEDKLQRGVPETIEKLRRAKIKLWMLTGDKRETAINIGHSCHLIKDYSSITVLDHEAGDVDQRMAAATLEIGRGGVAHSVVVIDGQTLASLEAEEPSKRLFLDLAILVDSVVCCRASPSQKAWLVSAIRRKVKHAITLAIGDGANDIAMIQEAHVGIGITGKEGLQAARTSDYSIAQFRFLLRLLLVHGRWNYVRTCKYTLGTFWKEMLFYLTQALFQRYAGYTGTSLYEPWSLSMFNTLFTSLPVIFLGIFEKDLGPSTLLAVPELYTLGHCNGGFNLSIYVAWVFMATSEAMLVFFPMLYIYGRARTNISNDLYSMGALTFTACVIIIATKLQFLEIHNKSITCVIAMLLSIGGWWSWNLILSAKYSNNVIYHVRDGLLYGFGRNSLWWLTLVMVIVSVWTFEIALRCLKGLVTESDVDVFQELEKDPLVKQRFDKHAGVDGTSPNLLSTTRRPSEWVEETRILNRTSDPSVADQVKREGEVQQLLNRPRVMFSETGAEERGGVRRRQHSESEDRAEGAGHGETNRINTLVEDDERRKGHAITSPKEASLNRRSFDVQEMLKRGFGSVRRSLDV
ncbi:MAG: hypothetical protein Q9191_004257 [Dirinaria sp. TL-2023a]